MLRPLLRGGTPKGVTLTLAEFRRFLNYTNVEYAASFDVVVLTSNESYGVILPSLLNRRSKASASGTKQA